MKTVSGSGLLHVKAVSGSDLSQLWHLYDAAYQAGDYVRALEIACQAQRIAPDNADIISNVAVCHLRLDHLDEAIAFAEKSLALRPENFVMFDALSHAYGEKGDFEAVRHWGLRALMSRAARFTGAPVQRPDFVVPPPPSARTREHNIIAFSLFGNRARYCETAILNARAQPSVYPDWTCVFYVNESVPPSAIERLRAAGAVVVVIDPGMRHWPGTMWRFAAADMPAVHRILFRDADSLISKRERVLVDAWVESGQPFHHIRDWHTHTELLHAGLWGMIGGALPDMRVMTARYLRKPPASMHFADQYFLREQVWPYVREDLLAHDSLFGFMDGKPHPDGPAKAESHIGANIAHGGFRQPVHLPDGVRVVWELQERIKARPGEPDARLVCSYSANVWGGYLVDHLPAPYLRRIGKDMRIVLHRPQHGGA